MCSRVQLGESLQGSSVSSGGELWTTHLLRHKQRLFSPSPVGVSNDVDSLPTGARNAIAMPQRRAPRHLN